MCVFESMILTAFSVRKESAKIEDDLTGLQVCTYVQVVGTGGQGPILLDVNDLTIGRNVMNLINTAAILVFAYK